MKIYFEKVFGLFLLLGFIFIPLNFWGYGCQYQLTSFIFENITNQILRVIYDGPSGTIDFSSDTKSLNILLFILFSISLVIGSFFRVRKKAGAISAIARICAIHYLIFILLKYGADKLFHTQFYQPEPNILYSEFGSLTKDMLYWSTMGTSRSYNIFLGLTEITAALLMLFVRTRIIGLLMTFGILLNIIAVNFGFDISVKTFSLFILATSLYCIFPYLHGLINVFFRGKPDVLTVKSIQPKIIPNFNWIMAFLFGISVLFVFYPYFQAAITSSGNDKRYLIHGAYEPQEIIVNGKPLDKLDFPILRIFIHQNNYIIFQHADKSMNDFYFNNDSGNSIFLNDYHQRRLKVNYENKIGRLILKFSDGADYEIKLSPMNWKALPALRDDFQMTLD